MDDLFSEKTFCLSNYESRRGLSSFVSGSHLVASIMMELIRPSNAIRGKLIVLVSAASENVVNSCHQFH